MSLSSMAALLFELTAFARLAKVAASVLLSVAVCGWVAGHCGPPTGEVVAHVLAADVEVKIDGDAHRIGGQRHEPIVLELPGGRHELMMRRGERILYEESFEVRRGESLVLAAWDQEARRAGPASCSRPATSRAGGPFTDQRSRSTAGPCPLAIPGPACARPSDLPSERSAPPACHGTCTGRPNGASARRAAP